MAMLIVATLAPVVVSMAGSAEDSMSTAGAEAEAERIADGISRAYYGGDGAVVTVQVSLGAGESLALGGSGGDAYAIRVLVSGEERAVVYIDRPAVPVLNELTVSGEATLTIACEISGGTTGVRVSA